MASDERQDILLSLLSEVVSRNENAESASDVLGDVATLLSGTISGPKDTSAEGADAPMPTPESLIGQMPPAQESENGISNLTRQIIELTRATLTQTDTVDVNTQAVIENSIAAASGSGSSTGASIGKTVLSFLGGGFGLATLFGKLFGGGGDEPAAALERYSLPASVSLDAGLSQTPVSGIQPIRYASDGLPRTLGGNAASATTPITIQVQAMDSKSFLDHSSEIANAVREALLNSHSLNDVVVEL